ncbi:MAG: hypothetical protein M3088_01755, partial [Actinomycetota bacterium]|nr:hypothetical protein [Actinomycetota bacterium]
QQHLTDLAYRRALALIVEHRPLLDDLTATLLEREVIERADIERIVGEESSRGGEQAPSEPSPPGADPETRHTPVAELPVTAARRLEPLPHALPHADPAPE